MGKHHGHSGSPTYISWKAMMARCRNPAREKYARYGGRGITVCERWNSFTNFLADMGERPAGKTLDRYPNNDGNYEPSNCRWATYEEQKMNSDHQLRMFTVNGVTKCLSQWCVEFGVKLTTAAYRMKHLGMTFEQSMTTKLRAAPHSRRRPPAPAHPIS